MKRLNRFCYAICIACIVAGALMALGMIWGIIGDNDRIQKSAGSIAVVFAASTLTLCINKAIGG